MTQSQNARTRKTFLGQHMVLFHAAAIGAHARFGARGFRQKDLRFLIELFSNWLEATLEGPSLEVDNTQIARYVATLMTEGLVKQASGQKPPRYRLTRTGLMDCLFKLVDRPHWWPIEEFFFVYYFLESYRNRIEMLIANAGTLYTGPMKLEIHQWLDLRNVVERQTQLLDMEIAKLDLRIEDCRTTSTLVKQGKAKRSTTADILRQIQDQVPYQLNNQKPMAELFTETPDEDWIWEMEVGSEKRATQIFLPMKELLVHIRSQVIGLRGGSSRI